MMKKRKNMLRILGLILLIMIIGVTIWQSKSIEADAIIQHIEDFGPLAWLVFMLLYAVGTVFFFPGSVLTLAGGAMFGPVLGTLLNLTSATIGAALAFLVARYMASGWIEEKTGGRLKQLKDGVENEGWRFVAFVRLVPLFPFNLLNYALGLTRIKFSNYLIATYICMLPGAIAYTYLGYAGREAVGGGEGLIQKAMMALALLAIVAFLPRIIRHFRMGPSMSVNDLHQRLENNSELVLLDVRSREDFRSELGHVKKAINIPLEELGSRLEKDLSEYTESPIALICTTDRRSKKAAEIFGREGFSDVHIVIGGMTDWNKQDYSIETG